ncbi:hypothetical protein ASG76_12335 [Nocardioides sp. Soil774]|uniref:hypothetical protein n=1 Tax=Nocardioides sp. Soil774 TaxID=1736408 RepID=UPI0006FD9BE0|nr:hypothetical protein [Nocardioides sp. Soil774]KRE94168.1 hypothetical protein ASG76_12335 [Nocardioides sp. Soil774]
MSFNVALVGVLAAALVGVPVAPRAGVQPGADRAPRSYTVRASVASHRVVEDSGFVEVSGRVLPRFAHEPVILQQRVAGSSRWKRTDRGATTRGGKFYLLDMPSTPGLRHYRVVKPGSHGLRAGTSKPMRVVVLDYEWASLLGRHVALQNVSTQPVDVAGTPRDGGITLVDPSQLGYAEFDLAGRCELVEVGTGMAKTSAPGSVGWAYVHRDDVEDVTEVYRSDYSGDGPSLYGGLPVAGAGRVRIELGANPTPPGYPSVFKLRAFCAP